MIALSAGSPGKNLAGKRPVRLDLAPQLFVDDHLVAARSGVVRRVEPCRKLPGPVLEPEFPWEGSRVYVYGTVLHDPADGLFRMWYMSRGAAGTRDPRLERAPLDLVLHATSRDGIGWTRPELGLYEYDGSAANNIVFALHSPSIIRDPFDPDPQRRFKMVGSCRGHYWAAHSADGRRWRAGAHNPILAHSDTITLTQDPDTGEYLAFHKINTEFRGYPRRVVYLATSRDFEGWTEPELVLAPDEQDDAWASVPGQRTEFYNLSVFPHTGQYLGWVTVFAVERRHERTQPDQSPWDGPIHAQLVHSRDGRCWRRCEDRSPAIPNGPDAYDAGCILGISNAPVVQGDEIWFYYTGVSTTHGGPLPQKRITIGRATWLRDRFASLAAREEGVVETVPLEGAGETLVVNADAAAGSLRVAICGEYGHPLSGYTREDCVPLRADSLRHQVRWKERDHLPLDGPVRLRIHLDNARLYSISTLSTRIGSS